MKNIVAFSTIILWAVSGLAQIQIREKATISPTNLSTESIDADYFVAPQSGTLLIWGPDQRGTMMSSYPLSDSDSLWVVVNDTLIYKFMLLPHLHLVLTMAMPCGITFYMYGWNNASDYAPADSSCTFTVNEGDRIIFALHTKYIAAMYPPFCGDLTLPGTYYPTDPGGGVVFLWSNEGCVDPTYGWFENFEWWNIWLSWVQTHSILLGETKYYEAVPDESDPSTLDIKELTDPGQADADRVQAKFSLWPEVGNTLGVYWEEYKNRPGETLSPGIIRLVGRYWQPDTAYKVGLSASTGTASGSIDIEVKKPASLGTTPGQGSKDAYGISQDIDSLVIQLAGKYGIPPQYLKAQVEKESSFYPAYRYEPFVDVNGQKEFSNTKYDGFRITSPVDPDGFGSVAIPEHSNVHPPYLKYTGTVWSYLFAHSRSVNPNVSQDDNLIPITNSKGILLWYERPALGYQHIFYDVIIYGGSLEQAYSEANAWLKNMYADGNMNKLAQTRLAASYGLFQIQYPTATSEREYPINKFHPPEKLNESQTGPAYSVPYLLAQVQNVLKQKGDGDNNWALGFEETFRWAFSYYNGKKTKTTYGIDIVDVRSKKFQPPAIAINP